MSVRKWIVVIAAGLISAPAPVTEAAAGLGTLKHYRLPTSNSPHDVTDTLDGNVWFTVQGAFDPVTFLTPGSVARVTPRGNITEFAVCDFWITNDIVQGPDGILYISDKRWTVAPDQHLGRRYYAATWRGFMQVDLIKVLGSPLPR